jgi:hypothetical protein
MYDPITIAKYGQARQQELLHDAEAYWKARLIQEERGQNSPARRSRFQRAAHLLTMLHR